MQHLYKMWPEIVNGSVCEQIIDHANKMILKPSTVGANEVKPNVRSSRQVFIKPLHEDFKEVFEMCYEFFNQANSEVFGFDIQHISGLQFANYQEQEQGHYDWHIDTFWKTDRAYHRKLSMVIQLSDPKDYEGGELELASNSGHELPNPDMLRKRGSVIVFPSIVSHRVVTVTKGERYSLVVWIHGPRWR
jgi:PKHD-type hydroxylase